MTGLPPSHAPDPSGASHHPPTALPSAGWVVGAGAATPATMPAPAARLAARLEARLAVYAQHAATVAEQAAATLVGDLVRSDTLAREREASAEHFGELQLPLASAGGLVAGAGAPSFEALLSDALVELEHQAAVDLALRQRLVALRDAVSRGASWAAGGVRALPASTSTAAGIVPEAVASPESPADVVADESTDDGPVRTLERGWVAARADGVGRALGGHYPGVAARGDAAAALTAVDRAGGRAGEQGRDGPAGAGHVDLRF
jgi:hypothetical protein